MLLANLWVDLFIVRRAVTSQRGWTIARMVLGGAILTIPLVRLAAGLRR